jgi:hypothetical protein
VLIGCDGINSVVAKWLCLAEPSYSGRMAARGLTRFPDGHGFEPKFLQFNGRGFRSGMRPWHPATTLTSTGSSAGLGKESRSSAGRRRRRGEGPMHAISLRVFLCTEKAGSSNAKRQERDTGNS